MQHGKALSCGMCPLLTEDVVARLRQCGIISVAKLVCTAAGAVSRSSGLPCSEVETIQHALLRVFAPHPVSGRTLLKEAEERTCIFPFVCVLPGNSIDELLKGGVYTAELTELWGVAGSGKTQLCISLTCRVVSNSAYTVAYVDGSAGGFDSTHLWACLEACRGGEGVESLMEKVHVFRVFSVYELLSLVHSIQYHITHQSDGFYTSLRLLVIDPVTLFLAPLLAPFHGQGQILMTQLSAALRALAAIHHIAVLYCNNVVSAGDGSVKPALGQTWSHVPCTRLYLSQARAERSMTVSKSPRQRPGVSTNFAFMSAGTIATNYQ